MLLVSLVDKGHDTNKQVHESQRDQKGKQEENEDFKF